MLKNVVFIQVRCYEILVSDCSLYETYFQSYLEA